MSRPINRCSELGSELKLIREIRGLTQPEAARAVHRTAFSNYLSKVEGGVLPSEDLLRDLLAVYRKAIPLTRYGEDQVWRLFYACRYADTDIRVRQPNVVPFVPRQREESLVEQALGIPDTRIVTLRGIGGVGKTELAVVLANRIASLQTRTVRWSTTTGLTKRTQLMHAVGAALRVEVRSIRQLVRALRQAGPLLLVLDGFEGLIGLHGAVAELLTECPHLQLLVTSQFKLDVIGEIDIELEGLDVPPRGFAGDVNSLRRYGAARLFLDQATPFGGSPPSNVEAPLIAEICRFLEGIPLAVQLAATRFRLGRPAVEILEGIGKELGALGQSSAGVPPHQSSMQAAMNWTYSCLSIPQRLLYQRLSIFDATFDRDMVEGCCVFGELTAKDARDALNKLIEKTSLIRVDRAAGLYEIFDVMKVDARARLSQSDRRVIDELRADYFLRRYCDSIESGAPLGTDRVQPHYADVRMALDFLIEAGKVDDAARLALCLIQFWSVTGREREGMRFVERLHPAVSDHNLRPRLLHMEGNLLLHVGNARKGTELLQEALRALDGLPDGDSLERQRMVILSALGNGLHSLHRVDESMQALKDARSIAERRHAWDAMYRITSNIAMHDGENGNIDTAALELRRLREVRRADVAGRTASSINLSLILSAQGKLDEARTLAEQARRGFTALGDVRGVVEALHQLGRIHRALGEGSPQGSARRRQRLHRARRLELDGLDIAFRAGLDEKAWLLVEALGELAFSMGRLNEAGTLMSSAKHWWADPDSALPSLLDEQQMERDWIRLKHVCEPQLLHEAEIRGGGMNLDSAVAYAHEVFTAQGRTGEQRATWAARSLR